MLLKHSLAFSLLNYDFSLFFIRQHDFSDVTIILAGDFQPVLN